MNKREWIWYALLGVAFLVPLTSFLSVRILVLALLLSVFSLITKRRDLKIASIRFWDILLYILASVCGLFYSQDISTGFKVLETSFGFFAISIVFFSIGSIDEEKIRKVFNFFSSGLLVASVVCVVNAVIQYLKTNNSNVFLFYELTNIIKSHPTYFAYYLIFAITVKLYFLNYEKAQFRSLINGVLILFFFLILILTGGQTAFVSILLVFSFFILKFILGERSKNQKFTFVLVIFMMTSMFLVSSTQNSERENRFNDSWDRFALWNAAIDANPNWLFGVGTGDAKDVLNEYFNKHGLHKYADENLNSHNQFIQTYLANGIVGLLALVLMLARPLYLAFKNNNALGVLVFFPFLIYGMTEVFLGRYQGVVFFALLHQVFVSYYASLKPSLTLKEA